MDTLGAMVSEYAEAIDATKAAGCGKVACWKCLQDQYYSNGGITYDCDQKRGVYVARYVPVHCKEVLEGLGLVSSKDIVPKLLARNPLKFTCLGSGPGTDVLAGMRWLMSWSEAGWIDEPIETHFLRIELNKGWNTVARDVCHRYKGDANLKFKHWYSNCDVTTVPSIKGEAGCTNVFTMSYLISELDETQLAGLAKFIANMADQTLSILVINDRPEDKVKARVGALLKMLPGKFTKTDDAKRNCGIDYSAAHKDKVRPKLMTNSVRWIRVLHDN